MVNGRTRAIAVFVAALVLLAGVFALVQMRAHPATPVVAKRSVPVHRIARAVAKPKPLPVVAKPVVPAKPAKHVPTVFEQEQAMGPSKLMKRWEPYITEAARRFHFPAMWIRAAMRLERGGGGG